MKTLLTLLLALALGGCCLSGCSTQAVLQKQTPAEIAAQICPPLTQTVASLQLLVIPDLKVAADLTIAGQVVDGVCGVAGSVNTSSLKNLVNTALPALITGIKASPLPVSQQNIVILDLTAANIVINGVLAAGGPTTAPAPAPVASAASGA